MIKKNKNKKQVREKVKAMATYGREKKSINRQKMRIILGQFSKICSPYKSEIAFLNTHTFKSQPTNIKEGKF